MIPFELVEPTSLAKALELLNPDDATVRPIAGGTALMLMMKAGVFHPEKLVSLRKIEPKYSSIVASTDGLRIGAMTTLGVLERSVEVKKHTPLIRRTLLTLSNVRVRNVATVGGALAHGDPHMDLPPVLMALGGLQYSLGAAAYAFKRPRLWPRVFGYHELFHLAVITASVTFYVVVVHYAVPYHRAS